MKNVSVLVLAAAVVLAQTDVSTTTAVEEAVSPTAIETGTDNVIVTGSVSPPTPTSEAAGSIVTSVSESIVPASTVSAAMTMTTETFAPTGKVPTNGTAAPSVGPVTLTAGAAVYGVAVSGVLGGLLAALAAFA
ncbi:hypothetical protein E4U54_003460 [Claviceps lovelessii]|nr:hypothetical protein E4U54_003460 [Claviceps lovelessii]